jgi:hypothetical protein
MTVVLIPLKLIPNSPCTDTKHPAAARFCNAPCGFLSCGPAGTAPLQSAHRPQDSILILTQRRLPEKSKRQNMLKNSQIAKMKDIQP